MITSALILTFYDFCRYQYRLCPVEAGAPTEECFRAHPLAFASNFSVLTFEDGSRPDARIPVVDVTDGVTPRGSTWRRNPIPACNCDQNDDCGVPSPGGVIPPQFAPYEWQKGFGPQCPTGVQFPPPCEGCFGWNQFNFSIMDEVRVPSKPGRYMISWP